MPFHRHLMRVIALLVVAAGLWSPVPAQARDSTDPVHVAVIVSSDRNRCFVPGVVTAIRHFVQRRADEINARGGLAGRRIVPQFHDHYRDAKLLQKQMAEIVKDPSLVAMIGINSSSRGATVIEAVGKSGVPLVSGMSRGDIFAPHKNAFSLSPAVNDEIAAVRTFMQKSGYQRPVFVGFKGDIYAERYAQELIGPQDDAANAARSFWLPSDQDSDLGKAASEEVIDAIAALDADIVFLGLHSGPGAQFLVRMMERDLTPPVFVALGRIGRMLGVLHPKTYKADMYQLGREQVPHVYNERLEQRIWQAPGQRWIFENRRATGAPEKCKKFKDPLPISDVRTRANRRAIGRGTQYADILSLIAHAAARPAAPEGAQPRDENAAPETVEQLRQRIIRGIDRLRPNQRIFRGLWQDWSFTADRSVAEDILILHKPDGLNDIALAPIQYRRGRVGTITVPVLYAGIDMTRIFRVDSNEKTFHADFFLSLRNAGGVDISDIAFVNAFRSPLSNEPVISVRVIEGDEKAQQAARLSGDGVEAAVAPQSRLRLYKVTGKFYFSPDLRKFPFDRQRLSISVQPANTKRPFLIQPPPPTLRKASFDVDNWELESQYVGLDRDIITVIGEQAASQYLIPLTTFNYTWTVKRLATDHYLQVMVPLVIILLVTWLSTFIPTQRLESVVAIQVTALLSSIALYLAVPKVEFDHATVSDILFVITYLAISLMLGTSILRTNLAAWRLKNTAWAIGWIQMLSMPAIFLLLAEYLLAQEGVVGQSVIETALGQMGI